MCKCPVVQRRARINGDHVRLRWVANGVSALIDQVLEQHALVELRAANQKVVRCPFAQVVLSPSLAQPFAVGLKAACRQHASAGSNAFFSHVGGNKASVLNVQPVHSRVVANLYAKFFGAAVIGVDQGFASAHEKRIGARHMQRA